MTEPHETFALPAQRVEQTIGELAVRPRERQDLFSVTSDEVLEIVPSATEGGQAFLTIARAMNPNDKRLQEEQEVEPASADPVVAALTHETTEQPGHGRGEIRKSKSAYGMHLIKLMQTGAQYLSTFDDQEEGVRAGREIMPEELDEALGNLYTTRVVPAAQPIRRLRQAADVTMGEMGAGMAGDDAASTARRYTLLKALGYDRYEGNTNYDKRHARIHEPEPEFVLTAFYAMNGKGEHRQLSRELQTGMYDPFIAHDILRFLDGVQEAEGDLAKVQQLVKFLYVFSGQPANRVEFYARMVNQLDTWPAAQLQVIREARQFLSERLENRVARMTRVLRQDDFIIDDPKAAFQQSLDRIGEEILRRAVIHPSNKAMIMQLRAKIASEKRGRATSRRDERRAARKGRDEEVVTAAVEDGPREPAKIVICNLNDYSIGEDPTTAIDEFVAAASQGNVTVRQDIERMLSFMARRDLPPTHRRGVKPILGAVVRFGLEDEPDKLWNFFEFKPTEAAGLPLKTNVAKNSRVYFIKLDDDTIGVIGIKPRADQEAFLRSIRVRTKRRDDA